MSANCPRCSRPLEDQQLDEVAFRCCRDCKGMLIGHTDLIGILENSWHAVPQETAEVTSFRSPDGWQNQPTLRCPDCHQTMDKYGYMGMAAIQINRCDPCAELWLDADELQNMVLALAKSNYRSDAARERSQREEMDIGEAGVQAAEMGGAAAHRGWLFAGQGSVVAPALSLLNELLR
ncbi:MAG: zf-TFIIB domain-containing protein [Verrucomicrobiia bacterium]|jgi:Zn-finger nucleic acid-binding protein